MLLTEEGKLFHVGFGADEGAKYAVLPGDPGRVKVIAEFLEDAKPLGSNREFVSYSGKIAGERVIVLSTGIGGPSAAIALEELSAAGVKCAVRIGTCGGMQERVVAGDMIIPTAAVRMEGTSREYAPAEFPATADFDVMNALVAAAKQMGARYHTGVIQSKDSFYGQHCPETMPVGYELTAKWQAWKALGVLASEMETAALFTVSAVRGIKTGCILHALWNQERAALGYDDPRDFDMLLTIRTAVKALEILIESGAVS